MEQMQEVLQKPDAVQDSNLDSIGLFVKSGCVFDYPRIDYIAVLNDLKACVHQFTYASFPRKRESSLE